MWLDVIGYYIFVVCWMLDVVECWMGLGVGVGFFVLCVRC